jgi:alpha-L-rhamnosidase
MLNETLNDKSKLIKPIGHIILFLFCTMFAQAQTNVKTNWQANWIGENKPSIPNTFHCYRYQFDLNEVSNKVLASIATDSKYWLWINEQLVVFEGQLKRGPTPNDTYYDEVDIQPFLQKGKNTIAILVWYWGKDGFCHKSSGKTGLLFEANVNAQNIVSNSDWKTNQHPCFRNSLAPNPNFRLPEHNIHYDARLGNEDWIKKDFDDSQWMRADLLGKAGTAPWNALWKRPIPQWWDSGLLAYENKGQQMKDGLHLQLPKNISVTPYFKIEAPAGLLIDVRMDNYYGGSEPNVRTEYITKQGLQTFETPAFMNGHEVIYHFPEGVKVIELKYRETKYDTKNVGYFQSNDSFLNRLWQKSVHTLNVNLRDGIQDSPDRERAQWWGDIVIVLEEMFYSCDRNALPAIQKSISNLLEWQKKNGVLFSPIPAGNWDKELPAQMLAAVSKYGIWKYVQQSGDTAMIRYAYPFVKKYMALWKLNKKGLVQHRKGDWDWHDWGEKVDVDVLDNAWYYMALESSLNMSSFLQLKTDAAEYEKQMQSIRFNFQKYFWKKNHFASDAYAFFADDRANGLAVCAGLVSKQQWQLLRPMLDTTFHAGPYLEKYILEAYCKMNDIDAAIARMKKRYDKMVSSQLTTLWEGWEIGSATYGGGTYNHGWTGGPLSLMSGYMAGIQPIDFGFRTYSIIPQLGSLQTIACGAATAKGFIKMELKQKATQMEMLVETITADGLIGLPKLKMPYRSITVNGQAIDARFKKLREDKSYVYFTCQEKGVWHIVGNAQ